MISSSIVDGQDRVDERNDITICYTNAIEGEKFSEISLTTSGENVQFVASVVDNTLTISASLEQATSYLLTIPQGALCDTLGNVNEEIQIAFTTYVSVELLYSSISDGQQDVALAPTFTFEYNFIEEFDSSLVSLVSQDGASVPVSVSTNSNTVTVTANEQLTHSSSYTLSLSSGIVKDERLVESCEESFAFSTIKIEDRFFWTTETIGEIKDQIVKDGYNTVISNSAILNDLNDTNVENWLRFQSGDKNASYPSIGLGGNYWGTTNETIIEKMILDFDDYQHLHDINVGKYLTVAPENTFPFVVDAYLINSNGERAFTVGNETVTFVVEFNRDMDTTVPLRVRFGSYEPYADYEIEGRYVTARRWEGEYTLKTVIENGNQYFNISNGRASDDHYLALYEHAGRFMFEIDTTSAQAMIMQGEATDTGIQLTWMQDDFDTMLGYNVYRAESENGLYTRINSYVLSSEENSFFDDGVEPGKIYYYNFTVVKTDLTESAPSGKIVIRAKDTMAPDIYHSPVRSAFTGNNLLISATVVDNLQITSAKVYYRAVGATEWKSTTMTALNSKYTAIIGAENLTLDGLEYYIEAFDGISYTYKGSADNAYFVTVKLAIDANSKGDVDGDGAISVKDAQMVLMAKNGLYNLTEEEFLRADVDGNGSVEAVDAKRILDYVSGKITTIN